VIYVRVTRDSRGYENTFLLHSPHTGERPRILYWYRSAPGVRVGRHALDEDAIRTIDEQHPDIEFDWTELLEEAQSALPEVEQRPERRKAPRTRPAAAGPPRAPVASEPTEDEPELEASVDGGPEPELADRGDAVEPEPAPGVITPAVRSNPLLEQLVGREIASRLRTRHRELSARVSQSDRDEAMRAAWQTRVDSLDPDRWDTPEAVLRGVEQADRTVEELERLGLSQGDR
jgi:hypothetical protein